MNAILPPERTEWMLAMVARHTPYTLPLWRAAVAGKLVLLVPGRGINLHSHRRLQDDGPVCVLLSDDDGMTTGPVRFHCAKTIRRWARAAIIHAAGGEPEHYSLAVMTTMLSGRLAFIETTTEHAESWTKLLQGRVPAVLIVPRDGKPHPAPMPVTDLH